MEYQAINLQQKLELFNEHWSPKVISEMNDYQFKLVKLKGEFVWHDHADTDETFYVLNGQMKIEFEDGAVEMSQGDLFVIPKGKQHRPVAEEECCVLLMEPKGVTNTGETSSEMTAENDVWI